MRRRIDWAAIKSAYINGSETLEQLAHRFAVRADSVRSRAAREHWTEQRTWRQSRLLMEATERSIVDCAAELARLNLEHLTHTRYVWAKIMRMIRDGDHDAHDMRALVAALTDCQKIQRLALGASTANEIPAPPPPVEEYNYEHLSDEELTTLQDLLARSIKHGRVQ